jgi:hypothetical protein
MVYFQTVVLCEISKELIRELEMIAEEYDISLHDK